MRDPFRPSFGVTPPLLAGRDPQIDAIGDALDGSPGDPARATLYTGLRGVGKTVMLNEAQAQAIERGWLVVSETAVRGLIARLVREELPKAAARLELPTVERRIAAVTLPGHLGGVDFDISNRREVEAGLRTQVEQLTDTLLPHNTGLMITVDEVHRGAIEDLRVLVTVLQHAFREERPLALVCAGLPSAVSDLLADDVLTFLRRADRQELGAVDNADVADALREPIEAHGRSIDNAALDIAAQATGGYPFLIQLVGRHVWRAAKDTEHIDEPAAQRGAAAARRRLGSLVHEPSLHDLSAVDRTFLVAMARDDGPARMKDVAERLEVSANFASQYRLRLLASGMIRTAGYGQVDFALPYLREYLRSHAASIG